MDDDGRFQAWFEPWLQTRPSLSPLGWYVKADLWAAWNASRADAFDQLIEGALGPERAAELRRNLREMDHRRAQTQMDLED